MEGILHVSAGDLKERGGLDVDEVFLDGSFQPTKKRALRGQNQTWKGKGNKISRWRKEYTESGKKALA